MKHQYSLPPRWICLQRLEAWVRVISKHSMMDLKELLILFKSMLLLQLISELKTQGLAFASLTDAIPLFDNRDGGSRL